ncbi:hypothetical protein Landi51_01885 [Colletotrichum acutatum]
MTLPVEDDSGVAQLVGCHNLKVDRMADNRNVPYSREADDELGVQLCPSNRSDGVANDVPFNFHQTKVTVEALSVRIAGRNFADVIKSALNPDASDIARPASIVVLHAALLQLVTSITKVRVQDHAAMCLAAWIAAPFTWLHGTWHPAEWHRLGQVTPSRTISKELDILP